MLPVLGPLLSVGVGLVNQLTNKSSDEKNTITNVLSRLATEGNKEQLEAEIQKLSLLVDSDKAQAALNVAVVQQGGLGWRDWLGYGGTVCIIYSTMGISLLNWITNYVNATTTINVIPLPVIDVTVIGTLLTGMLGLAGVNRLSN